VDGKSTALANVNTDGGTNGDGVESVNTDLTNGNEVTTVAAVKPGKDGSLEAGMEGAVTAGDPAEQSSLNIGIQAGDETTASADTETSLDVSVEANGGINPSAESELSRSTQDEVGGELGRGEDTVDGDIKRLLSAKLSAGRDVHSQSGDNIGGKNVDLTLTPGEKRGLEGASNTNAAMQPGLKMGTG
jgi:hypothetical protein